MRVNEDDDGWDYKCDNCDLITINEPEVVITIIDTAYHFCNMPCANDWYLETGKRNKPNLEEIEPQSLQGCKCQWCNKSLPAPHSCNMCQWCFNKRNKPASLRFF